jgi:hypothetical protein
MNYTIDHFGVPFFDYIIKDEVKKKSKIKHTDINISFGGICNSIKIASKLGINCNLVVDNKFPKEKFNRSDKKLNFLFFNSMIYQNAIIINKTDNKRQVYLKEIIRKPIKIKKSFIKKTGRVVISYIEDFPLLISDICTNESLVISDFNNSINLTSQNLSFKKLLQKNFIRTNILLFSAEEKNDLLNYIKNLLPDSDMTLKDKIFISHSPKEVTLYNFIKKNKKISIHKIKKIPNLFWSKYLKTPIGAGDNFLMFFSYYLKNIETIDNSINKIFNKMNTFLGKNAHIT